MKDKTRRYEQTERKVARRLKEYKEWTVKKYPWEGSARKGRLKRFRCNCSMCRQGPLGGNRVDANFDYLGYSDSFLYDTCCGS